MRRLLVNDLLTAIPGTRTFWSDLKDWFDCEFVSGEFNTLAHSADIMARATSGATADYSAEEIEEPAATLIIRNATYFGPLRASEHIPTISLLQDIIAEGPLREMQEAVCKSSTAIVCNSHFTASKYENAKGYVGRSTTHPHVIPLPVDFSVFEPGNPMGLQQALGLPNGCIAWVGACQGAAGHVKGWDVFIVTARLNPDIPFVAVLKDAMPESVPPNVRCYVRLTQADLAKVLGACRAGLCTSRMESQHLAGIEMGACGLPIVVPEVGIYWRRTDLPGIIVREPSPGAFGNAVRNLGICRFGEAEQIRGYWEREFHRSVIQAQWAKLVEEVES